VATAVAKTKQMTCTVFIDLSPFASAVVYDGFEKEICCCVVAGECAEKEDRISNEIRPT
jgi:hypothetical protein